MNKEKKMKFIKFIAIVLILIVFIEGFNGEFSNPTMFDIIKWIVCIVLVGIWLIAYVKQNRR